MNIRPCLSIAPMSPVLSHPSMNVSALALGFPRYRLIRRGPRTHISPPLPASRTGKPSSLINLKVHQRLLKQLPPNGALCLYVGQQFSDASRIVSLGPFRCWYPSSLGHSIYLCNTRIWGQKPVHLFHDGTFQRRTPTPNKVDIFKDVLGTRWGYEFHYHGRYKEYLVYAKPLHGIDERSHGKPRHNIRGMSFPQRC